ncbi:hypothetical protein [Streptomyces sp. NPDC046976]|uniref:hypothetical protein n=1 Tax=Streptomyces sp. NPDC046976 TaxID=3155258 RepID=UPI0033E74A81
MTQAVPRPALVDNSRLVHGRAEAEALVGSPARWEPLTGGSGVETWRVAGPQDVRMFKLGVGACSARVAREAAVRALLEGLVPAGSRLPAQGWHGHGEDSAWLTVPWLNGPTMWQVFAPVRRRGERTDDALAAAVLTCISVAAVHQAEWVHGNIQPHHIILGPGGARLVDWASAWSPAENLPPTDTAGSPVHLSSPEMLARSNRRPVYPTAADEVWTLAASIWWAASGRWPRDYRALAIDTSVFTETELAKVLVRYGAPLAPLAHWPELEAVLRYVLEAPAESRPTALDLAQHLCALRV